MKTLTKAQMINEILQLCVVNNVYTSGELFFSLAFMSDEQLKKVCTELGVK
jgi:hypothetical protein